MNSPRAGAKGAAWAVALLALFLLNACRLHDARLRERIEHHPTRDIAFWGHAWKRVPLAARVAPAPQALVDKIALENRRDGFPERPVPAEPDPVFVEAVRTVGALLPVRVRMLADRRIIGIYVVRGLGGTGYTEAILDGGGKERYAVIVLDRDVLLKRPANAWATWKENAFFRPASGTEIALRLILEPEAEDTVLNAVAFILLHEMGHGLGMASGVHSSWNGAPAVSDAYPFTQLSWRMQGAAVVSRFETAFPLRPALRAYAFSGSDLTLDQAPGLYRTLRDTDFPSLQAAVNPWEDFAESFATYVHVVRRGKPYEVRLRTPGGPEAVFPSCWREGRCDSKKAFMRRWFDDPFLGAPGR
jgi:hypothetical protein